MGTRPSAGRHEALLYETDERFVSALVPWLLEGLEANDGVAVSTTASHLALLRDALGAEARHVSFMPSDGWYRSPGATVAGWKRIIDTPTAAGSRAVRAVGEVPFGDAPPGWARWTRYEAVVNLAFAAVPAWIVCPYDVGRLPPAVTDDAWRTHPTVWSGSRRASERFTAPAELLAEIPEPVPDLPGPPALELDSAPDVVRLRRELARLGERIGMASERVDDLTIVVAELGANAFLHGGGIRGASAWVLPDQLVCEIRDAGGAPVSPLAGYVPPREGALGGLGLWIARQLATWLVIEPDPSGGTVVRFGVERRLTVAVARVTLGELGT